MATTVAAAPRPSIESADIPPAIEIVRSVQDAIDKVPSYLAEYKTSYLERIDKDEFKKLSSSQSMLSKHPTYPVLMRDEAALTKEYLKKLKSKYIETSAKAQFLKFLRSDDNQCGPEENEKIEAQNVVEKAALRDYKVKLQESFEKATALARELEDERPKLIQEAKEANRLAKEVSEMRLELMRLGRDRPVEDRLTIAAADVILENQVVELQEVDTQLRNVQEETVATKATFKKLEKDIEELRPAVVQAKALLQADAAASRAEGREEIEKMSRMCEWFTSAEEMYMDLFGISTVETPSENEMRISWSQPLPYTVSLVFNPTTKQFADATITGLEGDFGEAIDLAVDSNDARQLLWYVRMKASDRAGR